MRCAKGSTVPFWKLYYGILELKEMKCTNAQNASSAVEHSIISFLYGFWIFSRGFSDIMWQL